MSAFEIATLFLSTGTLGGVVRLIFMLGRHTEKLAAHDRRLQFLERKVA